MLPVFVASILAMSAPCLSPPLNAPVSDPFRLPECSYCPGNRGIEYAPSPGTVVTASAAGTVSFSGSVAGTLYVVVETDGGFRVTYGKLAAISVHRGESVAVGANIGFTAARFFFGLRQGDEYIDPAGFLSRSVYRPYLVPTDGEHRRPPPPPRIVCP